MKTLETFAYGILGAFIIPGIIVFACYTMFGAPKTEHVDSEFKKGFEKGVKYGILSYMRCPTNDNLDFHIGEAQKWYWLIEVDHGSSLMARTFQYNANTN